MPASSFETAPNVLPMLTESAGRINRTNLANAFNQYELSEQSNCFKLDLIQGISNHRDDKFVTRKKRWTLITKDI